jgi:hypothetical protein
VCFEWLANHKPSSGVALPCLVLHLCCSTLVSTSLAQASTEQPQMRTPLWAASQEMQSWGEFMKVWGPGMQVCGVVVFNPALEGRK